jgi:TRAP-type C4-dicarboxylate transport system permease small subunit
MRRLIIFFESVLTYSAYTSIFIMMFLTTADAIGRYILSVPVTGTYEITENYLMPVAFFLALSHAYRRGFLIRVTFLVDRLPGWFQVIVNHIVQMICILYGVILIVATSRRAIGVIGKGTTLGNLNFPVWPVHMIVPIGLFSVTLLMLIDLFRVRSGKSRLFKEESPAA